MAFDFDNVSLYALFYLGPFLILITLTLICTTSCTGNVMYLRGVPRLNDSSYWDYYFLCNTVGASLLWEVNGTRFNRFESGEVGEALSGTLPSFTYTATLLSSKQLTDGQFTFDSLLIVSVPGSSSLDVVCSNGPSSNRTSNMENGKGVENSNSTNSIFLEYLLTENIVGDKISQTSIFICGVQNPFMYWHTGTSTDVIGFFEFDNVGEERRNLVQGANTVDRLAVVIADEPYQIVSVLFVIHTANVTVTCGDNQNETYLATIYESPSIPTVQTDPEIVSSSTLGKLNLYIMSNSSDIWLRKFKCLFEII